MSTGKRLNKTYKGKEINKNLVEQLILLAKGEKRLIIIPLINGKINEAMDRVDTSYRKGVVAPNKPKIAMEVNRNKQNVAKSISVFLAHGALPGGEFGSRSFAKTLPKTRKKVAKVPKRKTKTKKSKKIQSVNKKRKAAKKASKKKDK